MSQTSTPTREEFLFFTRELIRTLRFELDALETRIEEEFEGITTICKADILEAVRKEWSQRISGVVSSLQERILATLRSQRSPKEILLIEVCAREVPSIAIGKKLREEVFSAQTAIALTMDSIMNSTWTTESFTAIAKIFTVADEEFIKVAVDTFIHEAGTGE